MNSKLKKGLSVFYLLACMWTEFYYVNIAGGKLRIYHFASLVILLILIKEIMPLLKNRKTWHVGLFIILALLTALLSTKWLAALKSVISLILNCMTGGVLLLILLRKWIDIKTFLHTICYSVIGSCLVGIIQYLVKVVYNINIGFSAEQCTQIEIGMLPGLSTEANVFGRYLIVYMLLLLPVLIERKEKIRGIWLMYAMAVFCTLVNMTRTVLYPTVGVLVLLMIYYIKTQYAKRMLLTLSKIIMLCSVYIILLLFEIIPAGEYTVYKLKAFVSPLNISTQEAVKEEAVISKDIVDNSQQNYITLDDVNKDKAVKIKEKQKEIIETVKSEGAGESEGTEKPKEAESLEDKVDSEEADSKNNSFEKNLKDVGYDVSASYRAGMFQLVLKSCISDIKTFFIGYGWGQTYVVLDNILIQAGGGDWINILAYTGIIGFLAYVFMTGKTLILLIGQVWKVKAHDAIAVGTLAACISIGIAGLASSNIIFPYFWQLIFITIYLTMNRKSVDD